MDYLYIVNFWFEEIEQSKWWVKDPEFDKLITSKFGDIHRAANACELFGWRKTPEGRLAEIIVLDQFSRNMFRDRPESFASDSLALSLAQEAVAAGADKLLDQAQRSVLYMPYMHSESLIIHDEAIKLFTQNGVQATLDFELKHRVIVEKFGRYPHRNKILNRPSTDAEIAFLSMPDSSF